MRISFHTRGIQESDTVRAYLERRLHFALDRFARHVPQVSVYVEDVNGPRGGIDTKCVIAAGLSSGSKIVVEEKAEGAMQAIYRACQRMRDVISRKLQAKRRPILITEGLPVPEH